MKPSPRPCVVCGEVFLPHRKVNLACSRTCAAAMMRETKRRHAAETFRARFEAKIVRASDSCWLWGGRLNASGYGLMLIEGRVRLAHRVCFEMHRGPIPPGLVLDHLCRVRRCVNPDHLSAVTDAENVKAPGSLSPAKLRSDQTHCIHGHPFDESNTYRNANGTRKCRECSKRRQAELRARRREARAQTAAG